MSFPIFNDKINKPIYVLDFDGTLSFMTDDPFEATYTRGTVELLRLLLDKKYVVAILTGRTVSRIKHVFYREIDLLKEIHVLGQYGAEYLGSDMNGHLFSSSHVDETREELLTALSQFSSDKNLFIEDKGITATLHIKDSSLPSDYFQRRKIVLEDSFVDKFDLIYGKHVVEVMPKSINKGIGLKFLYETYKGNECLYAGDDSGDIPAFEQLVNLNCTRKKAICVGSFLHDKLVRLFEDTSVQYVNLDNPDSLINHLLSAKEEEVKVVL